MAAAASTAHESSALGGAHFKPAEVDLRQAYGGGLGTETPAARPSWVRRTRAALAASVWTPVVFKVLALVLGMLVLAGVGIASILSGVGGAQVPPASALGNDIHAAWLASKPAPSAVAHASSAPSSGAHGAAASGGSSPAAAEPANTGATTAQGAAGSTAAASAGMTDDGKVILNLATAADLRHLPGVGAKRADAILALRTRLGHFKSVNDLMRVKGIGVRGLKKILSHVVLDAPKPAA